MYLFLKIFNLSGGNIWEKLLIWYENSVIKELLDYISEKWLSPEFGTYENFSVSGSAGSTVRNVIIGLALGMMIAAALMFYARFVQGKFIRALLRGECFTPDRAMTLYETGMFREPSVRRELARGGVLAKLTRCLPTGQAVRLEEVQEAVEAEPAPDNGEARDSENGAPPPAESEPEATKADPMGNTVALPDRVDFTTARFYIPEELKYRAEARYDSRGSRLPQLILSLVVGIALAVLLVRLAPVLLNFADWLISVFAP